MGIVHLSYIQIPDNGMARVDLKHPSAPHEFQAGCITHTLCFHQPAANLITCCTLLLKLSNYMINLREKMTTFPCLQTNQIFQTPEHKEKS